jgi:hypothetical protein
LMGAKDKDKDNDKDKDKDKDKDALLKMAEAWEEQAQEAERQARNRTVSSGEDGYFYLGRRNERTHRDAHCIYEPRRLVSEANLAL